MSVIKTIGNKQYQKDDNGDWYEVPVQESNPITKVVNGRTYQKDSNNGNWYDMGDVKKKETSIPTVSLDQQQLNAPTGTDDASQYKLPSHSGFLSGIEKAVSGMEKPPIPPSQEELMKQNDYIYDAKSGMYHSKDETPTPEESKKKEAVVAMQDPVKWALNPFRKKAKEDLDRLNSLGEFNPVANAESVIPKGYKTSLFTSRGNEERKQAQYDQQHSQQQLVERANDVYDKYFDNGRDAKAWLQSKIAATPPEERSKLQDNETVRMALSKADEYDKKKEMLQNTNINETAVDILRKNSPYFDKQVSALERGQGIEESGDYYKNIIPGALQGRIVDEMRNDKDVRAIAEENPQLAAQLKELDNGGIYKIYPDYGKTIVRNMMSREYEKRRSNLIANPIFDKSPYLDKLADELFKDNPALHDIANSMKGHWGGQIETSGLVDEFGTGARETAQQMGEGVKDLFGLGKSTSERVYEGLKKEAEQADTGAPQWKKDLGSAFKFGGMLSAMGAAGVPLKGLGMSAKGVNALVTADTFYDTEKNTWTMKYLDEKWKAELGALLSTATYTAGIKAFPGGKIADGLVKKIEPGIKDALSKLDAGATENEIKNKLSTIFENAIKGTGEATGTMVAITSFQHGLDQLFNASPEVMKKYHPDNELLDVAKNMLIGSAFPQLLTSIQSRNAIGNSLMSISDHPERFISALDVMKSKGQISEAEFNKKIDDINFLNRTKQYLNQTDMSEPNKRKFLLTSMQEKYANEKKVQTPEAIPTRGIDAEIRGYQDTKEQILNGEDVAGKDEPKLTIQTPEGKATPIEETKQKALDELENAKDKVRNHVGDAVDNNKEGAIDYVAQQALNLSEDGKPHNDGKEKESFDRAVENFGRPMVDAAVEYYQNKNKESAVAITEPRKTGAETTKDGVTVIKPAQPERKSTSVIMPEENKVAEVVPLKKVGDNATGREETDTSPDEQKKETGTEPTDILPQEPTGGQKEPPKSPPPENKPTEADKEEPLKNKALATRLVNAKNVPEAAKEGIRSAGLKYEPKSQEEAQNLAKAILDEDGIDNAVLKAQAGHFGGDVNTLVQTEALNRLKEMEDAATDPADKVEHAKKFAEIAIQLDEHLRKQGRGIAAINFFYKKSPLGIQLVENAKRKEDFENWAKPKDKSWKETFDEMMKEPEFENIVKEKVQEGMKEERAASRKARIKKVDDFIDKAKDQFKGGATYATIIPPKVITAALEGIKQAYHAGEHIVKIVQDAIDYISKELGHDNWDKEKFRKEWEDKLKEPISRKPLTDEEVKSKILDKFRNKLKGLTDKQKEDVVRKSFSKIVESGGLDYQDFRKIIADVTGRGEMTDAEAAQLKEYVKKINSVEEAGRKARELRTPESLQAFKDAEWEAGKASKDLNALLYTKPNILKRITSVMQLNTLGIPALINNPIYNVWNHTTLRLPIGIVNTLLNKGIQGIAKLMGKEFNPETDIASLSVQKEFFKKLGFGTRESVKQLLTGLNRMDYIQKEIHGQQIRPLSSMKDLWDYAHGTKNLTKAQVIDKSLQATVGIPAEVVARVLNIGDKPQRFAAEGAQAAAFAKALNLKDIDYNLFIEFPREEAYRAYKAKGNSDAEAGRKADYIRDIIIKEGERSTFQQNNMLNDLLTKIFGGDKSGIGGLAKAVTVSPYIKIPANAYWSYYNLVNPEVAMLQSAVYGAKAFAKRGRGDNAAAKDLHEARYWFAHGVTGIAMRAVVTAMVAGGIFRPSNSGDDTKKEREGEQNYEPQGTVNISKMFAWLRGEDPDKVKGGLTVSNKWFGQWGSVGNTIASRYETMTPEQRQKGEEYFDMLLGNLKESSVKELEQGIFSNSSSLLSALNGSSSYGLQRWGVGTVNMFTNIVQPAALAQISKAQLPYYTKAKADSFAQELKNSMLTRSSVLRDLTGQYPDAKVGIWGDKLEKRDNTIMRLFGFSNTSPDNFAQPIYEDYKKTNDIGFFPPAVVPKVNGKDLNSEQTSKLEELIGHARKDYIAPFINDQATIEGFNTKYSELSKDDKKYVLQYLYELGKTEGEEKFIEQNPLFKKEKVEKDYHKEAEKEIFRILEKYKK